MQLNYSNKSAKGNLYPRFRKEKKKTGNFKNVSFQLWR